MSHIHILQGCCLPRWITRALFFFKSAPAVPVSLWKIGVWVQITFAQAKGSYYLHTFLGSLLPCEESWGDLAEWIKFANRFFFLPLQSLSEGWLVACGMKPLTFPDEVVHVLVVAADALIIVLHYDQALILSSSWKNAKWHSRWVAPLRRK